MGDDADKMTFVRALTLLEPYLTSIVIAGGWAHRLHAIHPKAQKLAHEPLATLDVDLALDDTVKRTGKRTIGHLLGKGFDEKPSFERDADDKAPSVCRYVPRGDSTELYIEFIAPLRGSEDKRGITDRTVEIEGITAQRLRHVDVLLIDPWSVDLTRASGYPIDRPLTVLVPNPSAYIVQKMLVLPRRGADAAKDLVYVHDTILLFAEHVDDLHRLCTTVTSSLPAKTVQTLRTICREHSAINDTTRQASEVAKAAGRTLSPAEIASVVRLGMERLLR